jgi:3alpha(or 20beta)-hydroxysteroid dehydrogenase
MERLKGKVAIVTGAARGTGEAIARRFVAEGARVWLGDVLDERGETVAASLGSAARYLHHDVTSEEQWQRIVTSALGANGRIDVLVNNAAVLHIGTIAHTPVGVARRILEVNTLGPFLGLRAVLEPMRAQGGGAIVNVGSIDGMLGMNGITAYAASKWGLRGLTKAAAMELGRDGVRVNCVCPSGGSAEMYQPWAKQLSEAAQDVGAYVANRGIPGNAPVEEIAAAVVFLASDEARHCTGVDLPVDGGAHAGRFIPAFNRIQ